MVVLSALMGSWALGVDYGIVYVRAPRLGDETAVRLPEVKDPIQMPPGADLMLLHPDGSEEVLVEGGDGSIVDPYVSFDGRWVYYARFHDQRKETQNYQRRDASRAGADIYKIDLETRENVRLTFQEWTPNTGIVEWSDDPLKAEPSGTYYLGYGIFNLGPCPLPGGKVMFTSSRNGFAPNKSYTFPNLQLFVMDEDGRNVEQVGHLNLGSALHPTVLMDGRVMFSSYEAQGLRDSRVWGLWSIWPDGRNWAPLMSAFTGPSAFHFQTQLSNGDIAVVEYYNQNNNGFGTVLAFPPDVPEGETAFGGASTSDSRNTPVERGIWWFNDSHPSHKQPRYKRYPFSPYGIYGLTEFAHGEDNASSYTLNGDWSGKVTHPSGAPGNDVLLVWTPGPANDLNRPTNLPRYDAGLYVLENGVPVDDPGQLIPIKNDPDYNELQPRAVVTYEAVYGVREPAELEWLPNDGSEHEELPEGTPFGLIGSSSFYKRDTTPGYGAEAFDGLDPFNTSQNNATSNWSNQGADAGKYDNSDIWAVRLLAMEPTSHTSYGPVSNSKGFYNHANERLRILGEIPLRKFETDGEPVLDPEGNPDTSFLAKIPADVPFTFQTLDRDGLVLNSSQTWHQVRPGEIRTDCGGCHAHSQQPLLFENTAAADPEYIIRNLANSTPLLSKDPAGQPSVAVTGSRAVDVEYYRDIKPILERSCVSCHSINGPAEAELVLDDHEIVDGYENTYNRLSRDQDADFGYKPVISNGKWRQTNASRYIRKFQSRRSLLIWKIFGRRLDGWTNEDHPTEAIPGDASTLPEGAHPNSADLDFTGTIMPPPDSGHIPLSEDEKILFARWVDLGCPIESQNEERRKTGWLADDLRPTLAVSSPRSGRGADPLDGIRISAFDYYSGLDMESLSVVADFEINGRAPGTELIDLFADSGDHIWSLECDPPIETLGDGLVTVSVRDMVGNVQSVERVFSIGRTPVLGTPEISSRELRFVVNGEIGRSYRVETSPDLVRWNAEFSLTLEEEGQSITVVPSEAHPSCFVRVVEVSGLE